MFDFKFIIICINSVWESTVLRSALHYITFDDRHVKSVHMKLHF